MSQAINAKNFTEMITGREYPFKMSQQEAALARQAALVVVYGASDDLMEFEGAISDEVGVYDGGEAWIDSQGLIPCYETIDKEDKDAVRDCLAREGKGQKIEALWCKEGGYSWTYKTAIPHETFEVIEEGEPYCRGIVFSLKDVKTLP